MRSSPQISLTLVVPGFTTTFRRSPRHLPMLERLIAAGTAESSDCIPALEFWQCELIHALRLGDPDRYPSAPLTLKGLGRELDGGTWMHADPVRFEMSGDGLRMNLARAWTNAELASLEEILHAHLSALGLSLQRLDGRLFLHSTTSLDVATIAPREALTRSLHDALPQGTDASKVRRLMTELQMLLHEKVLDDHAPNAIWLWGFEPKNEYETSQAVLSAEPPLLFANDPYVRGIYLSLGAETRCKSLPSSFSLPQDPTEERILVLRDLSFEDLEQKWFAPLVEAVDQRAIENIHLYLDGCSVTMRRSPWRFFRRSRLSLNQLMANSNDAA